MTNIFIHLRLYTNYSLAYGANKINNIIDFAKKNNMPAIAMTDQENLFGSLEYALNLSENAIQPIIGCILKHKAFANNEDKLQKLKQNSKEDLFEILLLAKNKKGYKNLLKIVSQNYLLPNDGNYVTQDILSQYSDGIIAFIGHNKSYLASLIQKSKLTQAQNIIQKFNEIYSNNLYIELTRHGLEVEKIIEPHLIDFAYKNNIPLVATNEALYPTQSMFEAHDILSCISSGRYFVEKDRPRLNDQYYLKSVKEMQELFADIPEAIENTVKIAKRCSALPQIRKPMLPHFPTPENISEEEELKRQAILGLEKRIKNNPDSFYVNFNKEQIEEYNNRLQYELDIIIRMKFAGYFLIVSDFTKWSKNNNIPVGPGRGSGAGSIIAWATEITDLDPIRFGLLFERFLNPERVSMPDFDIDFCQERREEVIQYVQKKYGKEKVAQIITFGKLQAKAVLKDVGRVLQLPYKQVDDICKMIPFNPIAPITLQEAIDLDPNLQKMQKNDHNVSKLLNIALKLEGLNRHVSTHAAGIIIGDQDLTNIIPLYKDPKSDIPVVQYSMKYTELNGLVKFDFLGLKTLTTIANTIKIIKKINNIFIDISLINLSDSKTFELLRKGNTIGAFQLESSGMRDTLKKMKPDSIEDIIALISLYRPGPMDNIPSYIARKHKNEQISYPHENLKECLKETYGIIIYQEQVMEIAKILAGYSLGEADLLRRAMGKKIKSEMDKQREVFVRGALKNNISQEKSNEIFDLVAKFAGYGFNKSHAAAYTLIGYQTAYLKANYPTEFMTALLNIDIHDSDKLNILVQNIKQMNIEILPPNINKSYSLFSIEYIDNNATKAIRYGLSAIKSVGQQAMNKIIDIREKQGVFKNIFEFMSSMSSALLNKRSIENLIYAGTFDCIKNNRRQLAENIDLLLKFTISAQDNLNQTSLFDNTDNKYPELKNYNSYKQAEKLSKEYAAFGFYLKEHPIESYNNTLKKIGIVKIKTILNSSNYQIEKMKIAGIVSRITQRSGKKGRFAYVSISDESGIIDLGIFDEKIISQHRELLVVGQMITIQLQIKTMNNELKMIVSKINSINDIIRNHHQTLTIPISENQNLLKIKELIDSNSAITGNNTDIAIKTKIFIKINVTDLGYIMYELPKFYYFTQDSTESLNNFTKLNS